MGEGEVEVIQRKGESGGAEGDTVFWNEERKAERRRVTVKG